MIDVFTLVPRVLLVSKNAPEFVVEDALSAALQRLTNDAEIWQEVVEIDVSTLDNELMLSPPSGAQVVRAVWAVLGDRKLAALGDDVFLSLNPQQTGKPHSFNQISASTLQVYPTPITDEMGQAKIVCAPRTGSSLVPDNLMALYKEVLIDGALAIVLATPTDFGNPKLASYYENRWLAGLDAAKGRVTRQKNNVALVATYGGI